MTKPLTKREIEILEFIISGKSNNEIAKQLNISMHTVKVHVASILKKMSVDNRVQATAKAIRNKLI